MAKSLENAFSHKPEKEFFLHQVAFLTPQLFVLKLCSNGL
jgi:hypothetical protein